MEQRIKSALRFANWAHVGGFGDDLAAAQRFQREALAAGYQAAWVVPFGDVSGDAHWTVKVQLFCSIARRG